MGFQFLKIHTELLDQILCKLQTGIFVSLQFTSSAEPASPSISKTAA